MLQMFRSFFQSKVGIVVTLGFLGIIAVAFASSDVANSGSFGGVAGGDRVAIVGDKRITTADLSMNAANAVDQLRQNDPTMSMTAFAASGGVDDILTQMMSRAALAEFGKKYGMRAGKRLVDSEIAQIPIFQDASGNFTQDSFRAQLSQRGLTEASVRDDFSMGLFATQIVTGIDLAPRMPASIAKRYAQLLQERRKGGIGLLPSSAYAPEGDPSEEQLRDFYDDNRSDFIEPERRQIRYGSFGEDAVSDLAAPSEDQIEERYNENIAQYEAVENRSFSQLVTPTQAAATAIAAEVSGGKSLAQAASEKGLAVSEVASMSQSELTNQTSEAVAEAGFATAKGALSTPAQGGLGWYVLELGAVDQRAAQSLDSLRAEISAALAVEQRTVALNDLTSRIEEELDDGRNLAELAEELDVELTTTKPVIATGQVYQEQEGAPEALAPIFAIAFEMEEASPQLAVTVPGEEFMIFDIVEITESATAPFSEIQDQLAIGWRNGEGSKLAKEAAARILERLEGGMSMSKALAEEEPTLPPADNVDYDRQEIAQQGQVPPVLALLFSMAQGTSKRLEAPGSQGWFIAQLDEISTPELADDSPMIEAAAAQLAATLGEEYVGQFIKAVEAEMGISRNAAAVSAVVNQLTGVAN